MSELRCFCFGRGKKVCDDAIRVGLKSLSTRQSLKIGFEMNSEAWSQINLLANLHLRVVFGYQRIGAIISEDELLQDVAQKLIQASSTASENFQLLTDFLFRHKKRFVLLKQDLDRESGLSWVVEMQLEIERVIDSLCAMSKEAGNQEWMELLGMNEAVVQGSCYS